MSPPAGHPLPRYLVHDAIDFHGNDEVSVVHRLRRAQRGQRQAGTPCLPSANQAPPASPRPLRGDTPSQSCRLWVPGCWASLGGGRAVGAGDVGKTVGRPGFPHLEGAVHQRLVQVDDHTQLAGVLWLDLGQEVFDSSLRQGRGHRQTRGGSEGWRRAPHLPSCPPREAGSPLNPPALAQGKHWR